MFARSHSSARAINANENFRDLFSVRRGEARKRKPVGNMQMSIYGYVPDSVGFVADEEPSWRMASLVIAVPPRLVL